MSDHKHHHADKKEKKLVQLLKNRRTQRINLAEDQLARGRELEKEREEKLTKSALGSSRAAEKQKKAGEPAWSAKMQQIRDKNTGRLEMSKERWNRFAGTESGGGRGL